VTRARGVARATFTEAIVPGGHVVDPMIWLLLIVGFLFAPLKLLGASWFAYALPDSIAALVLFLVALDRLVTGKPLLAASGLTLPLVFLAAYCLLEVLNPESPPVRSLIGLRSWLLYSAFYFVGLYTFRSVRQLERLYALLLGLGFVTALYGVYQWKVGPQAFAGWSEQYGQYARLAWSARSGTVFRAFSTFVAAGTFGGNMAFVMLAAFSVMACATIRVGWRVVAAALFAVMGAGIAASGSRGPVVILLLAATVAIAFTSGGWSKIGVVFKGAIITGVALLLIVILIGPVVGERFSSIFDPQACFWKWFGPLTYGVRIAREHPLGMGLGYTAGVPQFIAGQVIRDLPTTNIDSGYGSAAAELGFIGLALFTYFGLKVGIEGFRAWRRLPPGRLRDLLLGPALLAATYPIVSVIAQPQATLPSSIYFWLLIGMLIKAPTLEGARDADQLLRTAVHPGQ